MGKPQASDAYYSDGADENSCSHSTLSVKKVDIPAIHSQWGV